MSLDTLQLFTREAICAHRSYRVCVYKTASGHFRYVCGRVRVIQSTSSARSSQSSARTWSAVPLDEIGATERDTYAKRRPNTSRAHYAVAAVWIFMSQFEERSNIPMTAVILSHTAAQLGCVGHIVHSHTGAPETNATQSYSSNVLVYTHADTYARQNTRSLVLQLIHCTQHGAQTLKLSSANVMRYRRIHINVYG